MGSSDKDHRDRHYNARWMVKVVQRLKTVSCENSCRMYCWLAKIT